jgi:hypothetical protein
MSYPLESEKILKSVGAVGVLQPIIVSGCPCHGGYQIVAGFRRAYACRKIGIEIVNANIYQVEPENSLGVFWLVLSENASHRRFNDVEKSLILTKLVEQFHCNRDEVMRTYMPLLELAPNDKVLEIYLKIADFEEDIKCYIAVHDLPMTVLELLAKLSPNDRTAVFMLFSKLKPGINKMKELLASLDEIALREGSSIHHVLAECSIQDILTHKKYSGPQKVEHIRRIIREKRYPQFTDLEREYHAQVKQLELPHGLRLQTDRFFEDDTLSAMFHFQTPEQLRTFAEELLKLSQKTELQHLLDLIKGNNKLY